MLVDPFATHIGRAPRLNTHTHTSHNYGIIYSGLGIIQATD